VVKKRVRRRNFSIKMVHNTLIKMARQRIQKSMKESVMNQHIFKIIHKPPIKKRRRRIQKKSME
jgi:hypothetical protein